MVYIYMRLLIEPWPGSNICRARLMYRMIHDFYVNKVSGLIKYKRLDMAKGSFDFYHLKM